MDPVAHTLVGAALAQTGLKKASRYGAAALIIGANLPDIDVLVYAWGSDAAMYHRRGLTHGVLALICLPLILTLLFCLWQRVRLPAADSAPPFRPWRLLLLAYLGVLTHPLLDWLNVYGVRLLMPFDGRWFYGDTLFIVDPWFWLLLAAGIYFASASTTKVNVFAAIAAATASAMVTLAPQVDPGAKILWWLLLTGLLAIAWWRRHRAGTPTAAAAGIVALILYIAFAYTTARQAEHKVLQGRDSALAIANPQPANPLRPKVILVTDEHYRVFRDGDTHLEVPRQAKSPLVEQALADPAIAGYANWLRLPYWQVHTHAEGHTLEVFDLRYREPGTASAGIGQARVEVPSPEHQE